MKPRERALRAFQHQETDKVPKGEPLCCVDEVLSQRLLALKGIHCTDPFAVRKSVCDILHFDVVNAGMARPPRQPGFHRCLAAPVCCTQDRRWCLGLS